MAGRDTVVVGLAELDFGDWGDAGHPISRLVAYRHSFGHGSMAGMVEDIRTHREIIAEVIRTVPGLWTHDRFRRYLVGEQKDPIAEALGMA